MSEPKSFDFAAAFVTIDSQEAGAEFELLTDAGKPSGFFITLAGPDAECRRKFSTKASRVVLKAVGPDGNVKDEQVETVDREYESMRLEEMVAATRAWRYPEGFAGPDCTPENVRDLYRRHKGLYRQVLAKAGDLARFTAR